MAERNMIKEGFVGNTLTESLTLSGTQSVSPSEIDALVDENLTGSAITITGTNIIALEADLGARWKLDRIEYFTDDPTNSGIQMVISDNLLDFFPVTMTGSPPKYVGDIPDSTVSGSPRFIRLTHSGTTDVLVQEWRAINDDTLVDFGTDGDLTEIEIDDAPIGKASELIETLPLFNRFNKIATGFVFIDNTGTDADDEIQVAATAAGPFFGRTTVDGRQPDVTPWQVGATSNARIVSSGSYRTDFANNNLKGWTAAGFASASISGGVFVGNTSSFTPTFEVLNDFTLEGTGGEVPIADLGNFFTFAAADFDTVRVKLRIPTIDSSLVTEGPRLFWKNQEDIGFESAKSALAATSTQVFNNKTQDYIFDVGSVTTWSGVTRGFQVQPFTVTSGINLTVELHELEVLHSSEQDRVTLDFLPVNSGTFPSFEFETSSESTDAAIGDLIMLKSVVTRPCIITKVRVFVDAASTTDGPGMFLAAIDPADDPLVGSNWTVKRTVILPGNVGGSTFQELNVFWPAETGDHIGYSDFNQVALQIRFRTGVLGDSLGPSGAGTTIGMRMSTIAKAQSDIDSQTFELRDRNYLIEYEAISAGPYLPTGTYRTPIFDGGEPPALLSVDFEADTPVGTSIDSGGDSFDTLRARASDTPPLTVPVLGEATGLFYMFNDLPSVNDPDNFAINTKNEDVKIREHGTFSSLVIQNLAGTMLFHEQKQELWVLNLIASGTLTDFRPTWDAFTPEGEYLRTQHVDGEINYGYNSPATSQSSSDFNFEPVGFEADYEREEIYIIQRNAAFFVGAGTYYGLVLDLDGNFKEVFFRSDAIGEPSSNRFTSMQEVTYDGNFFYILTDDALNAENRDVLMVVRNGTSTDSRDIAFIDEVQIDSIPGLAFSSLIATPRGPKGIAFNTRNELLYLYFESTVPGGGTASSKAPEIFTLLATPDDPDPDVTTSFDFALTAISGTSFDSTPDRLGFRLVDAGLGDDAILIRFRDIHFTTNMVYLDSRDTFGLLQSREARFPVNFVSPGVNLDGFGLFNNRSFSFFVEIGSGTVSGTQTILPELANSSDSLWGTLSGTLPFETITTDSVLFPTGRFGQVEYTLNASSDRERAPFLLRSQIAQGLKVGEIPPSGTKDIFLRTEIDDDKTISDQRGRLKVFWQLEE